MKVRSPWIVAITIAVVIALNSMNQESGEPVLIYSDDSLASAAWRFEDAPVDHWVGVVLDQAGWERLPAAVGVPWTLLRQSAVPDFEREVAIVAYMGAMPTGGYGISVREAKFIPSGERASGALPGRLTLTLGADSPGPEDIVTQAFTYPVDIVTTPRDAWPQGALQGLMAGVVEVIAVDQDGRNWGPAHILAGGDGPGDAQGDAPRKAQQSGGPGGASGEAESGAQGGAPGDGL